MKHDAVVAAGIPVFPRMTEAFYLLVLLEKSLPPTEAEISILQSYIEFKCQDLENLSVTAFIEAFGRSGENFVGRENTYTLSAWKTMENAWMYEQYMWDGGLARGPVPLLEVLLRREGQHNERWWTWRNQHLEIFGS